MSGVTLPGDIPGLLRRCSPVVDLKGRRLVCLAVFEDGSAPCARGNWRESGYSLHGPVNAGASLTPASGLQCDDLALDLADATGRAHAAWWLIAQGGQAAWWGDMWLRSHRSADRDWTMCTASKFPLSAALQGITNDPLTLSDGSRWVDAEALRRVVLHVAGRDA